MIKAYFLIFFPESAIFKVKPSIILRYKVVYRDVIKRLIFDKKSLLKLLLFLIFSK